GQTCSDQVLPAIFHLSDFSHVGHGAAGIKIGKYRDLARVREDVSTLGHEMHTAENDVFAARRSGLLRKFVGVAAKISEADYFITLVVVSKDHQIGAQGVFGRS